MNYDVMRYRDLSVISLDEYKYLVIATDSCGSIGEKENDIVKIDIATAVENTARVAILEVLSVNATIINVIDSLTFERKYYGDKVISCLVKLLEELDIDKSALNGTTEDIWPTKESGAVVTVVGVVRKDEIKMNKLKGNESIYLFGEPLVGLNVLKKEKMVTITTAKVLSQDNSVSEIVPIGSSGIRSEIKYIAEMYDWNYELINDPLLDLPGGPSTCLIAFSSENLSSRYNECRLVGKLVNSK